MFVPRKGWKRWPRTWVETAEIKVDREKEKHVDAKNVIGESALEIEDDGKQSQGPYGSLAGSRKHDIRFRYDVEPPEALWYKWFMEQNLMWASLPVVMN